MGQEKPRRQLNRCRGVLDAPWTEYCTWTVPERSGTAKVRSSFTPETAEARVRRLGACGTETTRKADPMSLGTILLIILVIALLGGFSGLGGGPFYGTGYYGGGGLGLLLVIVLILVILGKI